MRLILFDLLSALLVVTIGVLVATLAVGGPDAMWAVWRGVTEW